MPGFQAPIESSLCGLSEALEYGAKVMLSYLVCSIAKFGWAHHNVHKHNEKRITLQQKENGGGLP